jgi:hypothetical protein
MFITQEFKEKEYICNVRTSFKIYRSRFLNLSTKRSLLKIQTKFQSNV